MGEEKREEEREEEREEANLLSLPLLVLAVKERKRERKRGCERERKRGCERERKRG